ncbi:hypothetical protein BDA99DRAFT_324833 [Phascolomyces articulosus]|uniref:Uncharacterized protein n=1 Tax=Phascolomyces articulosus TaxID=60185 RepID=A0AAD5K5R2_9FUNG|nr:hypothetical protein BDA99DRAFT_324833 [Phascolomyces articulosus]
MKRSWEGFISIYQRVEDFYLMRISNIIVLLKALWRRFFYLFLLPTPSLPFPGYGIFISLSFVVLDTKKKKKKKTNKQTILDTTRKSSKKYRTIQFVSRLVSLLLVDLTFQIKAIHFIYQRGKGMNEKIIMSLEGGNGSII